MRRVEVWWQDTAAGESLSGSTSADFRTGRALGPQDRLIVWQKPVKRPEAWSAQEFAALPETLTLRMIRLQVAAPGFRTRQVVLVTTLLDAQAYPAAALRELYGERWTVELHFHQIKVSLAMDVLRCKSPELIEREVLLHRIAYNLIRCLMQRSAHLHRVPLERISFKGSLDTLRHWTSVIAAAGGRRASRINSSTRCSPRSLATRCRNDPRAANRGRENAERKTISC